MSNIVTMRFQIRVEAMSAGPPLCFHAASTWGWGGALKAILFIKLREDFVGFFESFL